VKSATAIVALHVFNELPVYLSVAADFTSKFATSLFQKAIADALLNNPTLSPTRILINDHLIHKIYLKFG